MMAKRRIIGTEVLVTHACDELSSSAPLPTTKAQPTVASDSHRAG